MGYYLVGVDLSGTKLALALAETDGRIVTYETAAVRPEDGARAITDQVAEAVKTLTASIPEEAVLGVGVACAGLVEPGSGRVRFAPHLGWRDVPLRAMLEARLPWRVWVDNDANLALLGEVHQGVAVGKSHVVGVFVGSGIGAGFVLHGTIQEGAGGFAGELGHTSISWDGPLDSCGNRGCLEWYASGRGLVRRARTALAAGEASSLRESGGSEDRAGWEPEDEGPSVKAIARAAAAGDALAVRLVSETATYLGVGLTNVVNLVNPQLVLLGGGVIRELPELVDGAAAVVHERVLAASQEGLEVVQALHGREAAVVGATVMVKLGGNLALAARGGGPPNGR